jgi:hypothetical protein
MPVPNLVLVLNRVLVPVPVPVPRVGRRRPGRRPNRTA